MAKPKTLRAAAQQRFTRQSLAVAETVRAWQALREAEKTGANTNETMAVLRATLDNLEHEMEKA